MISIERIYEQWQAGDLTDQDAFEVLARHLATIQDALEPLTATEKTIKARISEVVERQGGHMAHPAYGKFDIRNATITKSYDKDKLDQLIIELTMNGQVEVARAIGSCKRESSRAGGLVVTRPKETKKEAID